MSSKTIGRILVGLAPAVMGLAESGAVPPPWCAWVRFAALALGVVGGVLGSSAPADMPALKRLHEIEAPRANRGVL